MCTHVDGTTHSTTQYYLTFSCFSPAVGLVQGGKASGFKNRFEGDTYDVDGTRLFQVKGTSTLNTRAVQVEELASSLNTNDCFVLETPMETYIWYGKVRHCRQPFCRQYIYAIVCLLVVCK